MYRYDEFDRDMVLSRVAEFEDQVARRLSGQLKEDEFKPLRLMNGVYLQLHAYMLRIAVPYGQLNPVQMRRLAEIAREFDRGYGHFTTRQNIQFNWVALKDMPEVLRRLAEVEMHAIQTSGNCIRNVTTDHFAGAAADEIEDPRPWCEIIRQWSTFHPEFSYLPRKFKIAVTAAPNDRAAIQVHDIGLQMVERDGVVGFAVYVGGGQGRTPHVAAKVRDFVAKSELLDYLEAIMRVYNRHGRRDNKYKARIKILVNELGPEEFKRQVETEFVAQTDGEKIRLPEAEADRIAAYFAPLILETRTQDAFDRRAEDDARFARWARQNVRDHKVTGYASATISLKPVGAPPGDATAEQMDAVADLAERFGHGDIRVSHEQNLVLPQIAKDDLPALFDALGEHGLATSNIGLVSDIICCPGLDYCNLANTRSIPLAQEIAEFFEAREDEIGELRLKMSGCINACGHHHVGHIGILGVDRKGEENYQISLGGRSDERAAIGDIVGPALAKDEVVPALKRLFETYLESRTGPEERFIDALERLGHAHFKEALYAPA